MPPEVTRVNELQGDRLPDGVRPEFVKPGDVYRTRFGNGPWIWAVRDPDGDLGTLIGYDVYEHDDHSISVTGELINRESAERWTLEQGEWRRQTPRAACE